MPLTERELYLFDVQGYLIVKNALHTEQIRELNAELDFHADEFQKSYRLNNLHKCSAVFGKLAVHPAISPYLEAFLGKSPRLDHAYATTLKNGSEGLRLHGGGTPYDPSQYYHFRDNRIYSGLTVFSWALSDVDSGDGGFACIPGSHKANMPCPMDIREYRENLGCVVQVSVRAGDLIIFTEALTHGTLNWNGRHDRRTLFYKYCPSHMAWNKPDINGAGLMELPYVCDRP